MMFDFIVSSIFWPLSIALPLYFQSTEVNNGLYYGLCSVFLGQCITIGYFVLYDHKTKIQEVSQYNIKEAIIQHIFQLEGFLYCFCICVLHGIIIYCRIRIIKMGLYNTNVYFCNCCVKILFNTLCIEQNMI
jgi:hypothetical protein